MGDAQVVELFCRIARHYLPYILSCNEPLGPSSSRWCAQCEKCAFVYALLAAFCARPPDVWAVFGDDLFQQRGHANARFEELLGARGTTRLPDGRALPGRDALAKAKAAAPRGSAEARMLAYLDGHTALKPLDCVGTKEEARLALFLAEKRYHAYAVARGGEAGSGASHAAAATGDDEDTCPPCTGATTTRAPRMAPRFFRGAVWALSLIHI